MYGKSPKYEMDWNEVADLLESSGSRYGKGNGAVYQDRYGNDDDSDRYSDSTDTGRDRYAPGRPYNPITGYAPLQLSMSYKGMYRPAFG